MRKRSIRSSFGGGKGAKAGALRQSGKVRLVGNVTSSTGTRRNNKGRY